MVGLTLRFQHQQIHNHMLDDQPHLYFMHFWANDDAKKLAEGLKAALAQINIAKS